MAYTTPARYCEEVGFDEARSQLLDEGRVLTVALLRLVLDVVAGGAWPVEVATPDYGKHLFSRDDFTSLASQLDGLKGRFILSLNDNPGVREVFANFRIDAVRTRYSVAAKSSKEVGEVLITNFKPPSKGS
jgi:hypothetical protein